jgi:hypothetical protein
VLEFKSDRIRDEWASGKLDPLLAAIVLASAQFSATILNRVPQLTCIWRSAAEEEEIFREVGVLPSGVHQVWRGVDIHADTWKDPITQQVADWINARWVYDSIRPTYKVALWEPHGTGPHLHIQTCHSGITVPRKDVLASTGIASAMM